MNNNRKESNSLVYRTSKELKKGKIYVTIKLADECKNGHQNFSITGELYSSKNSRADRYMDSCGCIHDEIEKYFPEFKTFISLHLSDYQGNPMYAVQNGFYHLKGGFNSKSEGKAFVKEFCKYYRMTEQQYDIIKDSENQVHFAINLINTGVIECWENQAKAAIKQLEDLCGKKFICDSVRTQFKKPSEDVINKFNKDFEAGYYSDENKEKRRIKKEQDKKQKAINRINDKYNDVVDKAKIEKDISLFILRKLGSSFGNWVYYNHTNTIKFNWIDYEKHLSEKDFNSFCENISEAEYQKLPYGISFQFGENKKWTNN